jgi:hypothetical protein
VAKHRPTFWMRYGGIWNDITSDVSQVGNLSITTGQPDYGQSLRPSKMTLTLEDPTGKYRPHLPTSPLYGLAGRNTPFFVSDLLLTEGFESASLGFTTSPGGGATTWARSTDSPRTGSWCYKSGTTAASAFSEVIITAPPGANMAILWYRTDSDVSDVLTIRGAGSTGTAGQVAASGTGGAWAQAVVPLFLVNGTYTLSLRYTKDAATVGGADAVYVDDVSFVFSRDFGEISSWDFDQTLDFRASPRRGRRWTDITVTGVLERVASWTDPLQSCMSRTLKAFNTLLGLWLMEDGREALSLSNFTAGNNASFSNITLEEEESPGGGATSIKLSPTSVVSGVFLRDPTSVFNLASGWQVSKSMKLAAMPTSSAFLPVFQWNTNNAGQWTILVNSTQYLIQFVDQDGNFPVNTASGWTVRGTPTNWVTMRVQVSISGGTVSWALAWYSELSAGSEGISGSYSASSIGRMTSWNVTGNAWLDGAHLAYVYGVSGITDDLLSGNIRSAFNGYAGESATARFSRLLVENGIGSVWLTGQGELMGPQRPDTLINLLTEVRDTDGGMMYDTRSGIRVEYRPRRGLSNQTPALTLTFSTNVAAPLKPVLDTLDSYNVVTTTQRDGGAVTVADNVSLMGTSSPPLGIGVQKQGVDVNVFDETRLTDIAYWWLGQGTVAGCRYPTVTVDLDAAPSIEAAAGQVRPGDRITITGFDPDVIDLIVLGMADNQDDTTRRLITYTCAPYQQYNVGVYDDTVRRYDSATSSVNSAQGTTSTSWAVKCTDPGDVWSQVDCPYDWLVAGERVTVTAMSAVTVNSPTSYTQTGTVVRSVNGVVKAQTVGTPINVFNQARYES